MVKQLILTIAIISTAFACTQHPMPEPNNQELNNEVTKAFESLAAAAKSLDTEKYFSHFDKENYTALNGDGTVTHSFEEFAKTYRVQTASIAKYESLEFTKVKITLLNDSTAVLVNQYRAKVELKSGQTVEAAGAGTQVWSKATGDWKLVNVSSSNR